MTPKISSALVVLLIIQATLQIKFTHQNTDQNLSSQKIAFLSHGNLFVSVQSQTNKIFVGTTSVGPAETFYATFTDQGDVYFKSELTKKYVSTSGRIDGKLTASGSAMTPSAAFHMEYLNDNKERILFKSAQNGRYVTGKPWGRKHYLQATKVAAPSNFEAIKFVLLHEVSIKSKTLNKYLSIQTSRDSETGVANILKFSANSVGPNQRFQVVQTDIYKMYLKSKKNGRFVTLLRKGQNTYLVANSSQMGKNFLTAEETPTGVHLKGPNGLFLNAAGGRAAQLLPAADLFEVQQI